MEFMSQVNIKLLNDRKHDAWYSVTHCSTRYEYLKLKYDKLKLFEFTYYISMLYCCKYELYILSTSLYTYISNTISKALL